MKVSWLVSAGAIALMGYVVAGVTHENVADQINNNNPGIIQVTYHQANPTLGKLISFACAVGVAGCLWKGLQPKRQLVAVQQRSPLFAAQPTLLHPSDSISQQQPQAYDDEPSTGLRGHLDVADKPVSQINIFDRIYTNRKRHIFIPNETGGGKTTLLLGAIEYIHNLTNGNCEFYGSTAKESPWLGLEHEKADDGLPKIITLDRTNSRTIDLLLSRLKWLQKKLKARQAERTKAEQEGREVNFRRVYVILDEWLQTLAIAKEKGAFNELIALIESFVLLGREDEFCVWLFGQDHQVQNAKINTGLRKNFSFIVPARVGGMIGLEDALTGRSPITTPSKGIELLKEAEALILDNLETGICYSNIFGHELLIVPYLPGIKRKRIFGVSAGESVGVERSRSVGDIKTKIDNKLIQFPKTKVVGFEPEPLEDYWS